MESDDRASGGCGVDSFLLSQQGKKVTFQSVALHCNITQQNAGVLPVGNGTPRPGTKARSLPTHNVETDIR